MIRFLNILLLLSSQCFGQMKDVYPPYNIHPYTHAYSIKTDHTQCGSSTSSNFPVLVSFTATALKDVAHGGSVQNATTFNGQTVPADVVLSPSSAFATLYNAWDFESWDNVNGIINVWMPLVILSNSADSTFYMGIGKTTTTIYQGGSVGAAWNSNYKLLSHLQNGTTLSALDGSTNGNNGTITGATAATGEIDGCGSFSGSAQFIDIAGNSSLNGTGSHTIIAWVKAAAVSSTSIAFDKNSDIGGNGWGFRIGVQSSQWITDVITTSGGAAYHPVQGGTATIGAWTLLMGVFDNVAQSLTLYVNGVNAASATSIASTLRAANDSYIGGNGSDSPYWNGSIDEVELLSTAVTADFATQFYNMTKPSSTFLTITQLY